MDDLYCSNLFSSKLYGLCMMLYFILGLQLHHTHFCSACLGHKVCLANIVIYIHIVFFLLSIGKNV